MPKESILSEVLAASIGGAFSASALYPLEVLKTKMQAESKSSSSDNDEAKTACETSPSSLSSSSIGDGEESDDIEVIEEDREDAACNEVTHQSAGDSEPEPISALSYAKNMYGNEGIAPFYAGIETSAFQSATEKALYFFAYTSFKNVYTFFAGNHKMGAAINLFLGCMAEWAHLPITLPLDCWTTKIQTGDNSGKAPLAILMTMLSEGDGIRGMYKGIQAYTVLCLKPSIQYTVFEQIKTIMLTRKRIAKANGSAGRRDDSETLTAIEAFLLGMVARTVATLAVFPYLRAKVMLQSQKSSSADGTKPNIPAMIGKMYSAGGIGECFQGIGPELTRGVFSAALMLMMKEKIAFAIQQALRT